MTEQEDRELHFKNAGFRCSEETPVTLPTGELVTVRAGDHLSSRITPEMNARELRALHLYSVRFSNGQNKQIDELELVELIGGEEVFQTLPEYRVTASCSSRIDINSVPSDSTQLRPPSIP